VSILDLSLFSLMGLVFLLDFPFMLMSRKLDMLYEPGPGLFALGSDMLRRALPKLRDGTIISSLRTLYVSGAGPSLSVVIGSAGYLTPIEYAGTDECFIYYN
jgi:hypothetical protein